jgi:hypothetical protein
MEFYVDGNTGTVKAWTNGNLIHEVYGFKKEPVTDGLQVAKLGFDPNYGSNYANFRFNIDEIYASSTFARVELSTKATWNEADTARRVQPSTTWSDDKITFEYNLSNLNAEEPKFLYIIDSLGNVNQNGFSLSGCPSCPGSPQLNIE